MLKEPQSADRRRLLTTCRRGAALCMEARLKGLVECVIIKKGMKLHSYHYFQHFSSNSGLLRIGVTEGIRDRARRETWIYDYGTWSIDYR